MQIFWLQRVPQGYEEMFLRRSSYDSSKSDEVCPNTTHYENINNDSLYENFIMINHTDVPDEITTTKSNLKCPSYENYGFEELTAQGRKAIDEGDHCQPRDLEKYSCSAPVQNGFEIAKKRSSIREGSIVDSRLVHHERDSYSNNFDSEHFRNVNQELTSITARVKEHVIITDSRVKLAQEPGIPVENQGYDSASTRRINAADLATDDDAPPLPLKKGSSSPSNDISNIETKKSLEEPCFKTTIPSILYFENKLAAFSQPITDQLVHKDHMFEDAPVLPPKEKSILRSRGSTPSNYPRLSRDSTDLKLTFTENTHRYRPCPTKGSPNYGESHDSPPPLPRKQSQGRRGTFN